jgi:LAO/AO transport system kinase
MTQSVEEIFSRHRSIAKLITKIEENIDLKIPPESSAVDRKSFKIGITGSSGAGKSSLINALVKEFLTIENKMAILLIDPISETSGGSLLGDRIKLDKIYPELGIYIRSISTQAQNQNIPKSLPQILNLLSNFNYEIIFIETIGISQQCADIRKYCDLIISMPAIDIGNELQYLKSSMFEIADIVFVNKNDEYSLNINSTKKTFLDEFLEIKSLSGGKIPKVIYGSVSNGKGIAEIFKNLCDIINSRRLYE